MYCVILVFLFGELGTQSSGPACVACCSEICAILKHVPGWHGVPL